MFPLSSTAFGAGESIPPRFTCKGEDTSPPLAWRDAPSKTRSFALIVDDPDAPDPAAPKRVWVHWVLYNVPAGTGALAEGASPRALPNGSREGLNDFGKTAYGGPCPPVGRHRYFHKLYALDAMLPDLGPKATKADVERAMQGHVLGTAELIGTFAADGH